MRINRERCLGAFAGYVAAYDPENPKVALKIEHTYRVAELAEGIARDEGLAEEDVDLAWLCGLLHDIGRFEQVRRFGTFSDAKSVSHAALGVQVLLDEGRLWDFVDGDASCSQEGDFAAVTPEMARGCLWQGDAAVGTLETAEGCLREDDVAAGTPEAAKGCLREGDSAAETPEAAECCLGEGEAAGGSHEGADSRSTQACADQGDFADFIATVVGTHSDFRLPEGLNVRTRMFCEILRDADKVDILKAVGEADLSSVLDVPMHEILASGISPAVREAFYAHRTVMRVERSTPADMLVSYACLLFEVVHPYGLRVAREQGYIWSLLGLPYSNEGTAAESARMAEHMWGWLAGRLGD